MLSLIINSSPLIALVAALDDFNVLGKLVERLIIPVEVFQELSAGKARDKTAQVVCAAPCCHMWAVPVKTYRALLTPLGAGEAAVIELALEEKMPWVVIDEVRGRRAARLCGLQVIGSLGLLVEAYRAELIPSMENAVARMLEKGIFLSQTTISIALKAAQHSPEE